MVIEYYVSGAKSMLDFWEDPSPSFIPRRGDIVAFKEERGYCNYKVVFVKYFPETDEAHIHLDIGLCDDGDMV